MASEFYDRQGNTISIEAWGKLREGSDREKNVVVAVDEIPFDGYSVTVSTVWLGMDHSFGDGPPLIFETMVFGGELDQECDRYTTEEQAQQGHAAMVARVQRTTKD